MAPRVTFFTIRGLGTASTFESAVSWWNAHRLILPIEVF